MSLLAEMFPSVSTSELLHCLTLAAGSVDIAAQQVLERMDLADKHPSSPADIPASSVYSLIVKAVKLTC